MSRLPQPGEDDGTWGGILNDFLSQAHNPDGTIKSGAVTKADVGLGNVDDTSDVNKPVSTAQQTAINQTIVSAAVDTSGNLTFTTMGGSNISAGNIKGPQGDGGVSYTATWTGSVTFTQTATTTYTATLTGDVAVAAMNAPTTGSFTITLVLIQDSTGSRTVTWPTGAGGILWSYGIKPTLSTAPGAVDLVHLFWTGQQWLGLVGGIAFA